MCYKYNMTAPHFYPQEKQIMFTILIISSIMVYLFIGGRIAKYNWRLRSDFSMDAIVYLWPIFVIILLLEAIARIVTR